MGPKFEMNDMYPSNQHNLLITNQSAYYSPFFFLHPVIKFTEPRYPGWLVASGFLATFTRNTNVVQDFGIFQSSWSKTPIF